MNKLTFLFTIFILFSFSLKGKEYSFRTLGPSEGMSQASAISIWQDQLGRIWAGNEVLNCYNGDQVTIYRLSDFFPQIEDADIHGICGDDSVLYLLAGNQLVYMNLTTNKLEHTEIRAYAIYCSQGNFYYSYENRLYTYDYHTNISEQIFSFSSQTTITTILPTDNHAIWLGTTTGLFKLEKDVNKATYQFRQIIHAESINSLYQDSQSNIWASSRSNQVFNISPEEKIQPLYGDGTTSQGEVFCFTESPSTRTIWMGTLAGIYTVSIDSKQVDTSPMLPTSMIYALYTDRQGTIWIGSYYGAIRYLNPQTDNYRFWKTDEERYDKIHGVVLGEIAEDKAGNLYVATEGSGINVINPKTGTIRHIKAASDYLPNDKIRALWFDDEYNRLFISTYMEGLCYLDIHTEKITPVKSDTLNSRFKKIIEEMIPFQEYLILLTQDGIYQMDRHTLKISHLFHEPELKELCSGFIRTIHIDDRNTLWVSSLQGGLFTINLSTRKIIRSYDVGLEIPSAVVSICGDSKQGLFFATSKSGLLNYMIEQDSFRIFSAKDNWLLNDICYNLALTSSGNLVVTSNQGITLLNISARKTIDSSWHIRLNNSCPISEISKDCGLFVSRTNEIYVGGLYGMLSFNENDMHLPNNNYSLYLSTLFINNQPYSKGSIADMKKIVLPYKENTLNITFASSNYMPSYHTHYQYKLEGLDNYWNYTDYKTITYSSLQPGNYQLIIQETTNPEKKIVLDILIQFPFWLSLPAFLIYIFLLAIIFWILRLIYKKKTELQISLQMERREIDRMEEINRNQIDFFTSISNEFRTPLTLILSASYSLLQELSGLKKAKMIQIRKQVYFLQNLISEFLDLQKSGWNKLELRIKSYSYATFIQEMCTSFSVYTQGKSFTYPKQYDDTMILWFDQIQLQKVFYNLFPAAFQLIGTKGKVVVTYQKKNNWIEMHISCYTKNPDEAILARLLKTLNSSDNMLDIHSLSGNSIGLALSKKIVELHKGELFIKVENDIITICLSLRLGEKHFDDKELSALAEPAKPLQIHPEELADDIAITKNIVLDDLKKYRLLLVDMNDEFLKLLVEVFSSIYNPTIQYNGKDGYEYAIKEMPDLIIAKTSISELSGIEFCKMIKSNIKTAHIPLILISSNPSERQQIEAIQAGADDYIAEPFNANIVYLRCNQLIKNQKRLLNLSNKQLQEKASSAEITTNLQDQTFLDAAVRVLEEHFGNADFDTNIWSKQLKIGRTQLFNRIKSITGMTPNDYILLVKMNHAMTLLQLENQMTVSEIAYSLGFSNPSYFTRCFKKHTGVTPQQFRRT